MRLVERDEFHVCGWAVETNAEDNDRDIAALFDDFFTTGKDALLRRLPGSRPGYFGLSWYSDGHERYCYLLGVQIGDDDEAPAGATTKTLAATEWAVANYPSAINIKDAWAEFFFADIPNAGYAPDDAYNLYFEYYPGDVHGDYELWVPVVPAHA